MKVFENTADSNSHDNYAALDVEPFDLDQLRRRCLGREELVERLLASFERRFPLELAELERSFFEGDSNKLVLTAHQLKGAAANISALRLQQLLGQIESAARRDERETVAELSAQLQGEWEMFMEYRGSVCSL